MLCSDLLWDAQSVSRKQVPTLQDAFLCCDRETLLSMVEQGYACRVPGWGQATPQQRRVARKRMGRALEAMLGCAVKRKNGKALCLSLIHIYIAGLLCGMQRFSLAAAMVSRRDDADGLSARASPASWHDKRMGEAPQQLSIVAARACCIRQGKGEGREAPVYAGDRHRGGPLCDRRGA